MEDKLKELRGQLAMVRHTESIKKSQLQEENALLKKQLQQQKTQRADITQISEEQKLQEGPLAG